MFLCYLLVLIFCKFVYSVNIEGISAPTWFFLELQIQFSAGQFWQRNRGNIGICRQPLVGSACRGCRTKWLDLACRAMSYLPLTDFFLPLNDHSPPAGRRYDSPAFWPYFTPVLPRRRQRGSGGGWRQRVAMAEVVVTVAAAWWRWQ